MIVLGDECANELFQKATSNLPYARTLPVCGSNVYSILKQDIIVLSEGAVQALPERLLLD